MQLSTFGQSDTEDTITSLNKPPLSNPTDGQGSGNINMQGQNLNNSSKASQTKPIKSLSDQPDMSQEPDVNTPSASSVSSTPPTDLDTAVVGNMPNNNTIPTGSIKPRSKGKRIVSILFLLLILALVVGASYYFFVLRKAQERAVTDAANEVVDNYPTPKPTEVESFASDTTGLVASQTNDGLTLAQMQGLVEAIEKTKTDNGVYPWDTLGNKPVPFATPLFNSVGEPYVAWLKPENTESNPLEKNMDVAAFVQNPNSKIIHMIGFNTWYAFCFAPQTDEYADQTIYSRGADEVGENGKYICIIKDLAPSTDDAKPLKGF